MFTRWRLFVNALRSLAGRQPLETPRAIHTNARRRLLHASLQSPEKKVSEKDTPLPFLNTQAHKFTIRQEYVASEEEVKRSRYAIPLGFSMFAIVMYFGYIRPYGEKDKAVMDFLTKDISDKIPPGKLKQIKQAIEEDEEISRR